MILFGSHAHGKPREDSDIDLLVISKDFSPMDLRQRMEVLGVASVQIMEPIEALGYTPDEIKNISPTNFLAQVVATGVKIS